MTKINGNILLVSKDLWEYLPWLFLLLGMQSEKDRASAQSFLRITHLVTRRAQASQTP